MYPRIVIRTPPPHGRTLLWLDVSPIIVGSHPNCDVVIALPGIASRHFQLELLPDRRVKIIKLEGKVLINGRSVKGGMLKEGIVLQIAQDVHIEFYDTYKAINPPAEYSVKFLTEPLFNKKLKSDY